MNYDPVCCSLTELCKRTASGKGRRDNPVIELCRVWKCTLGWISPKHGSLPPQLKAASWWDLGWGRGVLVPWCPTCLPIPQSFRHTGAWLSSQMQVSPQQMMLSQLVPAAHRQPEGENCRVEVWLERSFCCATCEDPAWLRWKQNIVQTTPSQQDEL